jgi:hypothetical protein
VRITVHIPMEPTYSPRTLRFVVESFSYAYQGATVYEAKGSWVDKDGELVYNKVWVVESYTDDPMGEVGWDVWEVAKEAEMILSEETIFYTLDGKGYYS